MVWAQLLTRNCTDSRMGQRFRFDRCRTQLSFQFSNLSYHSIKAESNQVSSGVVQEEKATPPVGGHWLGMQLHELLTVGSLWGWNEHSAWCIVGAQERFHSRRKQPHRSWLLYKMGLWKMEIMFYLLQGIFLFICPPAGSWQGGTAVACGVMGNWGWRMSRQTG